MIAATAFVLGLAALGGSAVSAAQNPRSNSMNTFVSEVASKFNLNAAEVQTVVDEVMKSRQTEMGTRRQAGFASRLAQAVTDGKLTQTQADLITAKSAELKASTETDRTANQTLTQEERKAKMEAKQTSLKEWATAKDIPEEYLRLIGGGGKGFDGHGGFRPKMTQ